MVELPRTRMTRQARREQILDIAARLIQRGGLNAVTMERVTEHIGVSKRILYRHFANADDVLVALFRREVVRSRDQIRESLAANPRAASLAGLRTLFQTLMEGSHVLPELLALRVSAPGPLEEAKETFYAEGDRRLELVGGDAFIAIYEIDGDVEAAKAALQRAQSSGTMSRPEGVQLNPPPIVRYFRQISPAGRPRSAAF